mgnify:CR=1 FL=1
MDSKIWASKASVKIEQVDSTLLAAEDSVFVNPVPDEDKEVAFHKTIFGPSDSVSAVNTWEDTVRNALVPEPIDLSSRDYSDNQSIGLYYVMVMAPSKGEKDRYIFDGEAPFGVAVNQVPPTGSATHFQHGVSADLANLNPGEKYDFAYSLRDGYKDTITTFTMVHDLQTNIVLMSISPTSDSVSQSYQPESFDPKLFEFPNYFFEGFESSLEMDFTDKLIRFTNRSTKNGFPHKGRATKEARYRGRTQYKLPRATIDSTDLTHAGIYLSTTIPTDPSQSLAIFMEEGKLQAIRGEVEVFPNGKKRITTEFDLAGVVQPKLLFSRLIEEKLSEGLKMKLLQGAEFEEPLFGPSGKLPKITREPRLPEAQPDQPEFEIPVAPKQSIIPKPEDPNIGNQGTLDSKVKEPLKEKSLIKPLSEPPAPSDSLKLENIKVPNEDIPLEIEEKVER